MITKSDIKTALDELEKNKTLFLAKYSGHSPDQLQKSDDETWSMIQVLEHILFSESGTLGYMKKKTSGGWENLSLTGEQEIKNSEALNSRLASDERYKAPDVLPAPPGNSDLSDLSIKWNQLRKDLIEFVDSLNENFYDRLVFRQPIAGPLNLLQTLQFLNHHLLHHIPQLDRIKSTLS